MRYGWWREGCGAWVRSREEGYVTDGEDRNTRITREFRENGGKVGGPFGHATIILTRAAT